MINDQIRQQARLAGVSAMLALDPVRGEPLLHWRLQVLLDDRHMRLGVVLVLLDDLTPIEPILQHQIQCPTGQRLATRLGRPYRFTRDLLTMPSSSRAAFNARTDPSAAKHR